MWEKSNTTGMGFGEEILRTVQLSPLSLCMRARACRGGSRAFYFAQAWQELVFLFLFLVAVFLNRYFSLFLKISIKVLYVKKNPYH